MSLNGLSAQSYLPRNLLHLKGKQLNCILAILTKVGIVASGEYTLLKGCAHWLLKHLRVNTLSLTTSSVGKIPLVGDFIAQFLLGLGEVKHTITYTKMSGVLVTTEIPVGAEVKIQDLKIRLVVVDRQNMKTDLGGIPHYSVALVRNDRGEFGWFPCPAFEALYQSTRSLAL